MQGTMMQYPLTLPYFLERAGQLFGRVEIVSRMPDKSLHRCTYSDFYRRARSLAAALQKAGLQRGERVGTLMWNHYAHFESYFGIPAAGGVLHTLNLRLHPDDIAYIANHAEDRFIIVDDILLPLLSQFRAQLKAERIFVVSLTGGEIPEGYESYEEFLQTADSEGFIYPELDENEAAGMCYTSGTTGRPKGVVYSHRAIVLHSLGSALPDSLCLEQRDVICPVVPMFHANAWGIPFIAAMIGAKQTFPGPHLDAESLLDLYQSEKVTISAGVPTIWMAILESLEKEPERWQVAPMRMVVGGSAAPESMVRKLDTFGMRVIHAWGMTEMTPLGTISHLKSYMDEFNEDEQYSYRCKQGTPVPFVEVRAINQQGKAPWDGETMGELQVRGPWVAANYYNLPQETDKFTEDGWFRTGDVVTIDAEGYVKITDRTKDLIKSGGEWISSVDLENYLMSHPAVKEAAVIAVAHPKWQERPLAAVVLRQENQATTEELRAYLADKFTKWWVPEAIVFIDEIPRTSAGKFLKSALRERFQDWQWQDGS